MVKLRTIIKKDSIDLTKAVTFLVLLSNSELL